MVQHRAASAPAGGTGGIAIERVFADIEVEGGQVRIHEVQKGGNAFAEIIFLEGFDDRFVQGFKPMQHVAFQFRHFG